MTQPANPPGPEVTLANWRTARYLQWSFQHTREVVPTARVSRGNGGVCELPSEPVPLGDVAVRAPAGPTTVSQVLATTFTDGFMVLHDGIVVAEEYPSGMPADGLHALMSVTKSLVSCVAAALVEGGSLDPAAPVTTYVPELAFTGYAGATVRHVLDMRSGIHFSEEYTDPHSQIQRMEQCIGWSPTTDPALPASLHEFLATLHQARPHGGPFEYRSCETDVLGWVCERAGGDGMPRLMSDLLWSRLGVEHDADISVDRSGVAIHNGGMSASMRDLARFGQMLLDDGVSLGGERVVSPAWVRDTLTGDADSRQAFADSPKDPQMPGGMYRNQFWLPYPAGTPVLLCLGIHGQLVYVDRQAGVVGVKLSSWPAPQNPPLLAATLKAFEACAAHLARGSKRTAAASDGPAQRG